MVPIFLVGGVTVNRTLMATDRKLARMCAAGEKLPDCQSTHLLSHKLFGKGAKNLASTPDNENGAVILH